MFQRHENLKEFSKIRLDFGIKGIKHSRGAGM